MRLSSPDIRRRGNALFLILIAVALFAALSYAITQSGRGGGSISKEQAALQAAQIIQTVGDINTTIMRMKLSGIAAADIIAGDPVDCNEPGWGTENPPHPGNSCSADFCTSGTTCIFAPEGGGLAVPQMPREAFSDDTTVSLGWRTGSVLWGGAGTFNGLLIDGYQGAATMCCGSNAIMVFPLKKEVCEAINRNLGLTGDMEQWGGSHDSECVYDGSYYIFRQWGKDTP